MELLAPWSLAGLVLVPAILLWGLLAPRGRPVVVGSLMLWRRALGKGAVGRPSARVRLKDPLLWLDALLVLLIVLACAQPARRTHEALEPAATIVVDRTASMRMPSHGPHGLRWRDAAAMLTRVLDRIDDTPVRVVHVPGNQGISVAEKKTCSGLASWYNWAPRALTVSRDVWPVVSAEAARNPDLPVVVVTDIAPSARLRDNVFILAPGGPSANAGIEHVGTRVEHRSALDAILRTWVLVRARSAPGASGSCDLEVFSDVRGVDRPWAQAKGFLAAGASAEHIFAREGACSTALVVRLRGQEDGFFEDNSAYLKYEASGPIRVLLVGTPTPAVVQALRVCDGVSVTEAEEVTAPSADEADLVVACGVDLPAAWKGPAAVVAPTRPVGPVRPLQGQGTAEWRVAGDHPLAEAFYLAPPRIASVGRYTVDPSAKLLLGTRDLPLMATWQAGGVRRLAVLFNFDEATTDWPRRAGFPVFWSRAVRWLALARTSATYRTYRPLEVVPHRGVRAPERLGFINSMGGLGVSFIGTDEGFQTGPGRDDSAAAIQALSASIEARRRATLAPVWPYLAAAALVVVLLRTWAAR